MESVDLDAAFLRITTHWDPHVAGELNGQQVKLVKLKGEFVWHKHEVEDELFLVHRGRLEMRFRDRVVTVGPGQFVTVPAGTSHRTRPAGARSVNLTFERVGAATMFED